MKLRERIRRWLRKIFGPKKRWYEIDMRAFVRAENARFLRENGGEIK